MNENKGKNKNINRNNKEIDSGKKMQSEINLEMKYSGYQIKTSEVSLTSRLKTRKREFQVWMEGRINGYLTYKAQKIF